MLDIARCMKYLRMREPPSQSGKLKVDVGFPAAMILPPGHQHPE